MAQVALGVITLWHIEGGQVVALGVQIHLAHLSDGDGIQQTVRLFTEEFQHLLIALQIVARVAHAHAVLLGDKFTGLHTQEYVVRAGVR